MRLLLLGAFGFVALYVPHAAYADARERFTEGCYDVLHPETSADQQDEQLKEWCLEQFLDTPTLVVRASRHGSRLQEVPAAVTVVSPEEVHREAAATPAELLRDVPGVEISDSGQAGLQRIRIRGEESRRTAILIDGQEFLDQREVGTPLLLAPEMIDRIEVVRGTGSVLHGSRAIGGVVNFITKKGGYHPLQGTISQQFDTATQGSSTFASLFGAKEGWSYRLAGTVADHEDRQSPDGRLENTSFSSDSLLGYLAYERRNHTLALQAEQYNSDSEVFVDPVVAATPPFRDFRIDAPERDRRKAAVFYEGEKFTEWFSSLDFDVYYQESDREFNTFTDLELDVGFPLRRMVSIFTSSTLDTVGTNLQAGFAPFAGNELIAGIEAKRDELDQRRLRREVSNGEPAPDEVVDDAAEQRSIEVFLHDEWTFVEDWTVSGGARLYALDSELESTTRPGLQPEDSTDEHVVGSAALRYEGWRDTTVWGSWSQGFNYPSLVNLGTGAFAGPDFVNPNPELDPETSESIEAGVRYFGESFKLDTTAFFTWADDYIDFTPCLEGDIRCLPDGGESQFVYDNVDEARSFGIEASASYTFDRLTPYGSASWIRRRFEDEGTATYDTGTPPFFGRFGVRCDKPAAGGARVWADLFTRVSTDSTELDRRGRAIERAGWATLNAALGGAFGPKRMYKVVVELNNVLDKQYVPAKENLTAPGANAAVRFSVDL